MTFGIYLANGRDLLSFVLASNQLPAYRSVIAAYSFGRFQLLSSVWCSCSGRNLCLRILETNRGQVLWGLMQNALVLAISWVTAS